AFAAQNRKDLCGLSIHTADFPGVGNFSAIEATWTIPGVRPRPDISGMNPPYVFYGVSLCCGENCSSRVSAGMMAAPWAWNETGYSFTAIPIYQLSPDFPQRQVPQEHNFYFNSSDTLWTRLTIESPTRAHITFSKFITDDTNLTVTADIDIGNDGEQPLANVVTRGNGVEVHDPISSRWRNISVAPLCGESAWWFVSDKFDPGEDTERWDPLPRFSPILIAGHGLETTQGKSFPRDLPLSGQARFWTMVRDEAGRTEELCTVKGFVDTGMTMVHAPNAWGI
ncbi:uncharacterized protein THITE_2032272, partial [Thermothielavioides terrestris NRRL 8126]